MNPLVASIVTMLSLALAPLVPGPAAPEPPRAPRSGEPPRPDLADRARLSPRRFTADFDGDGHADLALRVSGLTRSLVHVYLGGAGGLGEARHLVLSAEPSAHVVGTGDFDSDGYSDLLIATDDGEATIHRGGPGGLSLSPAWRLVRPDGETSGIRFVAPGDVDGDGFDDVLAAIDCEPYTLESRARPAGAAELYPAITVTCRSEREHLHFWRGSARGPGGSPAKTITVDPDSTTVVLAPLGDVNGDGRADYAWAHDGGWHVHLGAAAGVFATPAGKLLAPKGKLDGLHTIAPAGDVNGDGYGDVVAGGWIAGTGRSGNWLYLGSRTGLAEKPALTLALGAGEIYGGSLLPAGDVDGDGYDDVVSAGMRGAYLWRGGPKGLSARPAQAIDATALAHGSFLVYGAGDLDGDGRADLVLASDGPDRTGAGAATALVYRGAKGGLHAKPETTLSLWGESLEELHEGIEARFPGVSL